MPDLWPCGEMTDVLQEWWWSGNDDKDQWFNMRQVKFVFDPDTFRYNAWICDWLRPVPVFHRCGRIDAEIVCPPTFPLFARRFVREFNVWGSHV